jgi:ankyrin repeat protein
VCGCLQSGKTALHKAAEDGHSDVVKVLLEKGGGADLAKIQEKVSVKVE